MNKNLQNLGRDQARHFRSRLRTARDQVLADAEGFDQLIHEIESLGAFLANDAKKKGLHEHKGPLLALASESALHDENRFSELFEVFREGRNDLMHEGAAARRLAEQAVAIALVLEDALMLVPGLREVASYMVESPVCAQPWHTMKMIRHTMLARQFSFLPVRMPGRPWEIVADVQLAAWLPHGPKSVRKEHVALALQDAVRDRAFKLLVATTCLPDAPIDEAQRELIARPEHAPILVVDREENPVGILTAFDLL